MLAADKERLQAQIRRDALAVKQKELLLHVDNYGNVSTQAALFLTFCCTMLFEFSPQRRGVHPLLLATYYMTSFVSLGCFTHCLVVTLLVVVFGSSRALRGPDGSLAYSTEAMWKERVSTYASFAAGLVAIVCSLVAAVWIVMEPESASVASAMLVLTAFATVLKLKRVWATMRCDENSAVDLADFFRAIRALQKGADEAKRG